MKNQDFQDLKPIYVHESNYSASKEISVTDLTVVLIRHKKIAAIIFALVTAIGFALALTTPKTYTYNTTIEIGSQLLNNSAVPFEATKVLLAKIQYSHIPKVLAEYNIANPNDDKNYTIKSNAPISSNIILIEIKGTENQQDTLKSLLSATSQKAINSHNRIFKSIEVSLKARLDRASKDIVELRDLRNNNYNGVELIALYNLTELLSSQLANLRNTKEILPPIKSQTPTGNSRKLTVVVFIIIGFFLGIFSAFFAELITKVKQQLIKDIQ